MAAKATPANPLAAALQMLARRPHSRAEVRRALERKFGRCEAVNEAIARLRALGYLDDRKFAVQYASMLARSRGFGRERIRRELRAKFVEDAAIDAALDAAFEETGERDLLERALEKKLRSLRLPLTRPKFYALCHSLMRLGFRSDDIMKAVRSRPELKPAAENIEE
ncbi:MAG TPA: RecX family transcriptional regulator [Terriglobia bacterium]|nr:RecX family transcriptional regulator [Terriglobia bacterium]